MAGGSKMAAIKTATEHNTSEPDNSKHYNATHFFWPEHAVVGLKFGKQGLGEKLGQSSSRAYGLNPKPQTIRMNPKPVNPEP